MSSAGYRCETLLSVVFEVSLGALLPLGSRALDLLTSKEHLLSHTFKVFYIGVIFFIIEIGGADDRIIFFFLGPLLVMRVRLMIVAHILLRRVLLVDVLLAGEEDIRVVEV